MRRLLIDTNVILDYLLTRDPYYGDAEKVMNLCKEGSVQACLAAHSIPNIFYILRKDYTVEERRKILKSLCILFDIERIDHEKLIRALDSEDFTEFEDCLQVQCALAYEADYIITRNLEDFKDSPVTAITADEYVKMISVSDGKNG